MPKPWKKQRDDAGDEAAPTRTLHSAIVTEELDLHGHTADEAEHRLELFLDRVARTSPGEVVRVITGRGARSGGPPRSPRT